MDECGSHIIKHSLSIYLTLITTSWASTLELSRSNLLSRMPQCCYLHKICLKMLLIAINQIIMLWCCYHWRCFLSTVQIFQSYYSKLHYIDRKCSPELAHLTLAKSTKFLNIQDFNFLIAFICIFQSWFFRGRIQDPKLYIWFRKNYDEFAIYYGLVFRKLIICFQFLRYQLDLLYQVLQGKNYCSMEGRIEYEKC